MQTYPEHKTNKRFIRTPEGIVFSYHIASPVSRWLAWLLDIGVILTLTTAINTSLSIFKWVSTDFSQAVLILAYFFITMGYSIFFEWRFQGQTLGKRLVGLRVIDDQGLNLQFYQVVLRNLMRSLDSLPLFYAVGGISCILNRSGQRLGDIAANTIVIRNVKIPEPDLDQLGAVKYNSLKDFPHLAARLRQNISPKEAGIALDALIRRDKLDPSHRVRVFEALADHFKRQVPFPQDAIEGIPDEQYVRNVIDILFKSLY